MIFQIELQISRSAKVLLLGEVINIIIQKVKIQAYVMFMLNSILSILVVVCIMAIGILNYSNGYTCIV